MAHMPKDPVMLLSYINTQLRDRYASLDELCASLSLEKASLTQKLNAIGYDYVPDTNQFQ